MLSPLDRNNDSEDNKEIKETDNDNKENMENKDSKEKQGKQRHLWWKMTIDGRRLLIKDSFWWKTDPDGILCVTLRSQLHQKISNILHESTH